MIRFWYFRSYVKLEKFGLKKSWAEAKKGDILEYSDDLFKEIVALGDIDGVKPFYDELSVDILDKVYKCRYTSNDYVLYFRGVMIKGGYTENILHFSNYHIRSILTLLLCSRKGIYLYPYSIYKGAELNYINLLRNDILFACVSDDHLTGVTFQGSDTVCLVENYPFNGGSLPVFVHSSLGIHRDDRLEEITDGKRNVFLNKSTGRYWSCWWDFDNNLRWHWEDNIDEIFEYIDKLQDFDDFSCTYTVEEFFQSLEITEEYYKEDMDRILNEHDFSNLSILSHIRDINMSEDVIRGEMQGRFENLVKYVLAITMEKSSDDEYSINWHVTIRLPVSYEFFMDILETMSDDKETLIIYINSYTEKFDSVNDLDYVVLIAKAKKGIIELFDRKEGLKVFKEWIIAAKM